MSKSRAISRVREHKVFYTSLLVAVLGLSWLLQPVDGGDGLAVPIKVPDAEVAEHGTWHVVSVTQWVPNWRIRVMFIERFAAAQPAADVSTMDQSIQESSRQAAAVADHVARGEGFPAVVSGDLVVSDVLLSTWGGSGGSAGLALTLAGVDIRTDGDLTGGRTVAATGVIYPDGSVGTIGGAASKAKAVRRAGVDIFFVPEANYAEASAAVAGSSVQVIAVGHVTDAIEVLCAGTTSAVCQ